MVNAVHLAFLCQIDDAAFPGTFKFFFHVCKVGIPVVVSVHFIGNDFVANGLLAFQEVDCPAVLVACPIPIEVLNQAADAFAAFFHFRGLCLDDVEVLAVPCHHAFEPYNAEISHCRPQGGIQGVVIIVGIRLCLCFQGGKFFFQTCDVLFLKTLFLGVVVDVVASVCDFERCVKSDGITNGCGQGVFAPSVATFRFILDDDVINLDVQAELLVGGGDCIVPAFGVPCNLGVEISNAAVCDFNLFGELWNCCHVLIDLE